MSETVLWKSLQTILAYLHCAEHDIFDICFALGFPLFLYTIFYGPIIMNQETIDQSSELRMLLLILTILAFIVYTFRKTIDSIQAYMLLGIYSIFMLYVIGRGAMHPVANEIAEFLKNIVSYLNLLWFQFR